MKRKQAGMALALLVAAVMLLVPMTVSAAAAPERATQLSPALSVLAAQRDMAVATLCGNDYYFSREVFARTLNLDCDGVGAITVLSLPEVTEGELMMGSERVAVGQRIEAKDLQLLSFVAADDGQRQTSFVFSPAQGGYEMTCKVYVLSEVNYSPTLSMATQAALTVSTHRDFVGYGTLSAHDPEGDAMVFEVVRAPRNGLVLITDTACGDYVYLPREGFVGEDSFCYVARDVYGNYSAQGEICVSVEPVATQTVYADMQGRREYNAALSMTEAGIMQGEQVGQTWYFDPDRAVGRGEFLVMAMKTLGVGSLPAVESTGYADDAEMDATTKNYVAAATELGYVMGTQDAAGNACFLPNESITRAEAAVIVSRMIGAGEDVSVSMVPAFADGEEVPAWASEAIATLSSKGILTAVGGTISPNATLTRADAACMLAAMLRLQ